MNNIHFNAQAPCPGTSTKSEQGLFLRIRGTNVIVERGDPMATVGAGAIRTIQPGIVNSGLTSIIRAPVLVKLDAVLFLRGIEAEMGPMQVYKLYGICKIEALFKTIILKSLNSRFVQDLN